MHDPPYETFARRERSQWARPSVHGGSALRRQRDPKLLLTIGGGWKLLDATLLFEHLEQTFQESNDHGIEAASFRVVLDDPAVLDIPDIEARWTQIGHRLAEHSVQPIEIHDDAFEGVAGLFEEIAIRGLRREENPVSTKRTQDFLDGQLELDAHCLDECKRFFIGIRAQINEVVVDDSRRRSNSRPCVGTRPAQ